MANSTVSIHFESQPIVPVQVQQLSLSRAAYVQFGSPLVEGAIVILFVQDLSSAETLAYTILDQARALRSIALQNAPIEPALLEDDPYTGSTTRNPA